MSESKKCPDCGACKECGAKPQIVPWPYPIYVQPQPVYQPPTYYPWWQYTTCGPSSATVTFNTQSTT